MGNDSKFESYNNRETIKPTTLTGSPISVERKMDHNFAELRNSLNHIVDHLTKLSDLPEE